jgi:hypothetical protein
MGTIVSTRHGRMLRNTSNQLKPSNVQWKKEQRKNCTCSEQKMSKNMEATPRAARCWQFLNFFLRLYSFAAVS